MTMNAERITAQPLVYPPPREFTLTGGGIPCGHVHAEASDGSLDVAFALAHLKEKWARHCVPSDGPGFAVRLSLDASLGTEEYALRADAVQTVITSGGRLGLLYGVETFLQLAEGGTMPSCQIHDEPFLPLRGVHIGLPSKENAEFARRLVRDLLLSMRYNTLFIEFAGCVRLDSHPEIAKAWLRGKAEGRLGLHGDMCADGEVLEKAEAAAFIEYCKSFGFEVIPEIQSLSHVQYLTRAYPDIAEDLGAVSSADVTPEELAEDPAYHCYCPSSPRSLEIIKGVADEIIDLVKPRRYVHMGHDEVYQIGLCPRCRHKSPTDLYAGHVRTLHEYLRGKGLGMMLWADMLQPISGYTTAPAIGMLPRDIVLLDFIWYFHPDEDIEDDLLGGNFKVVIGNLYSSHYPRFSDRCRKPGMIGGEVSTWCRMDERTLAAQGKLFDFLYTANMLWSPAYDEARRGEYTRQIAAMIPRLRDNLRGNTRRAGGAEILYSAPDPVPGTPIRVEIGKRYACLTFTHCTRGAGKRTALQPPDRIGVYVVQWADGAEVLIPIEYGVNIYFNGAPYGMPLQSWSDRHAGYAATWMADPVMLEDGSEMLCFPWDNPEPSKAIDWIELRETNDGPGILLFSVKGVTAP